MHFPYIIIQFSGPHFLYITQSLSNRQHFFDTEVCPYRTPSTNQYWARLNEILYQYGFVHWFMSIFLRAKRAFMLILQLSDLGQVQK